MDNATDNSRDPLEETKQFQSRNAQRSSVYLCYAPDDQETARRLCVQFESRGTPCWFSGRDLTPVMVWPQCIIEAIESSKYFVLLLTDRARLSQDIIPEITEAYNAGRSIVILQSVEDVMNVELDSLLTVGQVIPVSDPLTDQDIESTWFKIVEFEANSTLDGKDDIEIAPNSDQFEADSLLIQLECVRGTVKGTLSHQMSPGDRIVFGRGSEADVFVDDDRASRRHAGLVLKKDQKYGLELHLMDLMSRNGTWVRYRREGDADISKFLEHNETRIVSGAILRIGSTDIRIKVLPIPTSIVQIRGG